jgi:AcrR family transcriptional regulator
MTQGGSTVADPGPTLARERNRRGEGGKLAADILAGATELLEQTGSEESVTLRAVARKVGISAPSIYAHFPDRAAIVEAIVDSAFRDFNDAIATAIAGAGGPLGRLRAGCAAYLRFAADRPNRYQLLFERRDLVGEPGEASYAIRIESFNALVESLQECVDAGISGSDDPVRDATAIWAALHGYATLQLMLPDFSWPNAEAMLDRIVNGLGWIDHGADA